LIQFYNSKIIKVFVFSKNIENKIIYFLHLFYKSREEASKKTVVISITTVFYFLEIMKTISTFL